MFAVAFLRQHVIVIQVTFKRWLWPPSVVFNDDIDWVLLAQTSNPRQTAEHFNITLRALNKHLSFGQIVYFAQTRKLKAPMVEGLLHILPWWRLVLHRRWRLEEKNIQCCGRYKLIHIVLRGLRGITVWCLTSIRTNWGWTVVKLPPLCKMRWIGDISRTLHVGCHGNI